MNINTLIKDWAYRVNDGCPDPKNRNHVELLEATLRDYKYSESFISEYIQNILEASLAGKTTNYKQPTGAFYKYVEMSPNKNQDYKTEKAAKLFDVNTLAKVGEIKKGQTIRILT